jgi:hypothetical protein
VDVSALQPCFTSPDSETKREDAAAFPPLASTLLRPHGRRNIMPARKKRSTSKRTLLTSKNATFFAKRTARGRFKEMDERGRSLAADRRQRATRTTKSGHGDQGDRRRRAA